ncbi:MULTISPECIES: AraC family transcriptional regulator [unclassified Niallia]|uniref:AraC family transcriptional regulator n=1 Tax=unclassified Niallia TaxID=2837522 RepID=UPI001EDB5F64|nr:MULTISPECIES: AraC family transcriptional regulator [unclassified Niallia]MCM3032654.1 AraC family transcriptional regulator [Niallia sp. MER 6]MDL0434399.1 AraC family transcriptional regulator [Niallia sp. SS-2023]UPO89143.1 AraC family transcriptional regulator [Niallia sp. Man26]
MTWLEGLQKALDYIEDHLDEELSTAEIAKQACLSSFHFQRTFSVLTDTTVGEYIRRRRLSAAGQELMNKDLRVIDAAIKYGYESPEAFTKAFRKQHGITPSAIRSGKGKLTIYNPFAIQIVLKGAEPMNVKIVHMDEFQAIGKKQSYSYKEGENLKGIPLFWEEANRDGTIDSLAEWNDGCVKGILGICAEITSSTKDMDYWIAVATTKDKAEGFETITIPQSKWAVFEVHGPMPHSMQNTWKQIYAEWFPKSGYIQTNSPQLEVYGEGKPDSEDYYSEIWIPVDRS